MAGVGQRPVVWIGHSMGGLIIKHIMVGFMLYHMGNSSQSLCKVVVLKCIPDLVLNIMKKVTKYLSLEYRSVFVHCAGGFTRHHHCGLLEVYFHGYNFMTSRL